VSAGGSPLAPADERAPRFTNLQLRLMTAAVGLPLLVGAILAGGWLFAAVAAIAAAAAGLEFGHGWLFPRSRFPEVLPNLLIFAAPGVMVLGTHADARFVPAGLVLAGLAAAAGYAPTNRFGPRKPWRVLAGSMVYVGLLVSAFVLLRGVEGGRDWFLAGVLGTFAVDTGAYAIGRTFGRHRMAPRISPKKTWEGAAGGYVAGAAAFIGLNALFDTGVSALTVLPFALAMPVLAQAGDLLESGMKRRMGVKDASGLLPGHGGFLDRLDSLVFVLPALYMFLQLRVL
jgi:phosphatidate cytidylyltransferase